MRDIIFRLVILFITSYVFYFEFYLYRRWRGRLGDRPWFGRVAVGYWVFVGFCHLPFLAMALVGRTAMQFPIEGWILPLYYITMGWSYIVFLYSVLYGAVSLIWNLPSMLKSAALFLRRVDMRVRGARTLSANTSATTPVAESDSGGHPEPGMSRGEFLRGAADALPIALSATAITGMFLGSREIAVEHVQVKIKNLHEDLKGLRIVQISDIHVGSLINEEYLAIARDIIKGLKGDLLVATGDIIDNNNYFIPVCGRFFRSLTDLFPMGAHGILGNHDYIDDAGRLYQALPKSGLRLLKNENHPLKRGKGELNLLGLDYPGRRMGGRRREISKLYYDYGVNSVRPETPTIVLNHHPSDFEFLRSEKIDLALSGHTHGGQIALVDERESRLALAHNVYQYYRGLYEVDGRQLYVNSGLGHWFPLRINVPAEITLIELV